MMPKYSSPSKALAKSESRLLDSIASAEMQKEVESRLIRVIKAHY
jgi:hypothetical protein